MLAKLGGGAMQGPEAAPLGRKGEGEPQPEIQGVFTGCRIFSHQATGYRAGALAFRRRLRGRVRGRYVFSGGVFIFCGTCLHEGKRRWVALSTCSMSSFFASEVCTSGDVFDARSCCVSREKPDFTKLLPHRRGSGSVCHLVGQEISWKYAISNYG